MRGRVTDGAAAGSSFDEEVSCKRHVDGLAPKHDKDSKHRDHVVSERLLLWTASCGA